MKAESILTFTATNSIPASLAMGNNLEEKWLFTTIRTQPAKEDES